GSSVGIDSPLRDVHKPVLPDRRLGLQSKRRPTAFGYRWIGDLRASEHVGGLRVGPGVIAPDEPGEVGLGDAVELGNPDRALDPRSEERRVGKEEASLS